MVANSVVGQRDIGEIGASTARENGPPTNLACVNVVATVRIIDANDPGSVLADIESGMTVIGASCAKLGTVIQVVTGTGGEPIALSVAYGLLSRKRKLVPGEFVDLVDGDRVALSIDLPQFKTLRDIDG